MSKKINTEIFYCPNCGNPLNVSLESNLVVVTCENCIMSVSRSGDITDQAIEETLSSYCEHAIESKALDVTYF